MDSFPETDLRYIIRPQYDLSMSLVIANLTHEGILLSGDKRGIGIHNESGEKIRSNEIKKVFKGKNFAWGIAGRNIDRPDIISGYFDEHLSIKASDTLEDIIKKMINLCLDYHRIVKYPVELIQLIIAGYENDLPIIHKLMYVSERSEIHLIPDEKYASIGATKYADDRLKSLPSSVSQKTMLEEHALVFEEVAKQKETVSEVFDSFAIYPNDIAEVK